MAMIAECQEIQEGRLVPALEDALQKLDTADQEMTLDFSSVRRVDARGLQALERLAAAAEDKGMKIVLRGTSTEVYKVLKLMKLAPRFAFQN
jgi:anti-anti-sigma regulatory factor